MRFLADVCIANATVRLLKDAGHDAVHLREEGLQRLGDADILRKADAEARIVLTFDLDFGDLLALGVRSSPSVVIFRLHDETPGSVNARLLEVLRQRQDELQSGALIVVEDGRYRMRRLPLRR
jgi:predicted nuclease of predicted toxin-antitoxin system